MTQHGVSRAWHVARPAFRVWRKSRPFWGGLLTVLAGVVIVAAPALNPLDLIIQQGIAGISGYFAGLLLMAVGVLVWLQPPQRFFYGIAAILLALVSFVTSNFGGFVFGMLFGLIGGALTVAWVPERKRKSDPKPRGGGARQEADTEPDEAATAAAPADADSAHGPARDEDDDRTEQDPGSGGGGRDDDETTASTASTARTGSANPPGAHRRPSLDGPTTPPGSRRGEESTAGSADSAEPGTGGGSTTEGGGSGGASGGGRLHSFAAIAAALVLAVPAPHAGATWPWDDWFDGGEEESPSPSPTPTTDPSSSPSEGPGDGGADGGSGDGEDDGQQDGSEEDEDEGDGDEDAEQSEPSQECTAQDGAASMSKEEYRALLEACDEAQERGEAPEHDVRQGEEGEGPWLAHTETSGLTADSLSMSGAAFDGVVEYPVEGGTVRYLKLSMDRADFEGARQWFERGEATTSLDLPELTMDGDVTMHVTRLKASILGIPLTFTPDFPPPLLLPSMTVTDLEVDQPLAEAQTVSIPRLDEQVEG